MVQSSKKRARLIAFKSETAVCANGKLVVCRGEKSIKQRIGPNKCARMNRQRLSSRSKTKVSNRMIINSTRNGRRISCRLVLESTEDRRKAGRTRIPRAAANGRIVYAALVNITASNR